MRALLVLISLATACAAQDAGNDPALKALRFEHIRRPRVAQPGANVTQMHYARRGIITPEMEFIAIRENQSRHVARETAFKNGHGEGTTQHPGFAWGASIPPVITPEFVRDGTRLACLEMLRGGITCFNDMYFFPTAMARAAIDSGVRAAVSMNVMPASAAVSMIENEVASSHWYPNVIVPRHSSET